MECTLPLAQSQMDGWIDGFTFLLKVGMIDITFRHENSLGTSLVKKANSCIFQKYL